MYFKSFSSLWDADLYFVHVSTMLWVAALMFLLRQWGYTHPNAFHQNMIWSGTSWWSGKTKQTESVWEASFLMSWNIFCWWKPLHTRHEWETVAGGGSRGQVVWGGGGFVKPWGLSGMPVMRKQASAQMSMMWSNPTYLYFKTNFLEGVGFLGIHNMLLRSDNPWDLVFFSQNSITFSMRKTQVNDPLWLLIWNGKGGVQVIFIEN